MKTAIYSLLAMLLAMSISCENTFKTGDEYTEYLNHTPDLKSQLEDALFWTNKINKTPNQHPYYVKRANVYSSLFDLTAKIEYLKLAEADLNKAVELTQNREPGYLRSLASNYISQHRFKEALKLLEDAENIGDGLSATQKMLFDVHLELGNYSLAEKQLDAIRNDGGFDYFIRVAKWEDHKGNLDNAIFNMEKATKIAESSNLSSLKYWSYTNLADFYGHAGEIEKSYNHYLKALDLKPEDAYAKKGIAWILYSHENKVSDANDIIDHCLSYYKSPDLYLLKAEISEYSGNAVEKETALNQYKLLSKDENYGDMYNAYDIAIFIDEIKQPEVALEIAKVEVENRPTPMAYDLLAWSYFNLGETEKAIEIIDDKVYGKTFEPVALFHMANIYKNVNRAEIVQEMKKELLASSYELGPVTTSKIKTL